MFYLEKNNNWLVKKQYLVCKRYFLTRVKLVYASIVIYSYYYVVGLNKNKSKVCSVLLLCKWMDTHYRRPANRRSQPAFVSQSSKWTLMDGHIKEKRE